jgi:hypothetical protein
MPTLNREAEMPDDRRKAMLTLAHALDAAGLAPSDVFPRGWTAAEKRAWAELTAGHWRAVREAADA